MDYPGGPGLRPSAPREAVRHFPGLGSTVPKYDALHRKPDCILDLSRQIEVPFGVSPGGELAEDISLKSESPENFSRELFCASHRQYIIGFSAMRVYSWSSANMSVAAKKANKLLAGAAVLALLLIQAACGAEVAAVPTPTPMEPSTPDATTPPEPTATSTDTALSPPGNVPLIPGGRLLISVIDQQGQPVEEGTVEAFIEYADFPERNRQDSFDLAFFQGLIPVGGPPEHIAATISLRVVTPDRGVSDTLVIRNDEYAFALADVEFVGVHEFDLGKTGVTTNLKLITIDIKPGSEPNCINLGSEGFIPVAILTTPIFHAADVDQSSLTLEGLHTRVQGKSGNIGSFEDVDGDGDLDLVVQFPTADLQLTEADTAVILEGSTLNGTPIQGVDAICVATAPTSKSTDTAPSPPRATPLIPGENLLISVIDQQGQLVQEGTVEASFEYADFPERNFQTSLDLAFFQGLIPIYPPPEHILATVSLWVVTPDGGVSDTLVIRNDEYALAFVDSELDFVAVHEFDLSKTGVTTNLKLVIIDIKPGSDPNCINLGSEDVISVAILATPLFDPIVVDQTSVTLGGVFARVKGESDKVGSFEDVDGDGDLDLVVQFPTADLQLTATDTAAVLEGATVNGTPIQGTDPICIVL